MESGVGPICFYLNFQILFVEGKFLFKRSKSQRDFTYINDAIKIIINLIFNNKIKLNIKFLTCSNRPIKITKIIDFFFNKYGKVKLRKISRNKLE